MEPTLTIDPSTSPPDPSKPFRLILITVLVTFLCSLPCSYLLFKLIPQHSTSQTSASITLDSQPALLSAANPSTYTSNYWGFSLTYPDTFNVREIGTGAILANFPLDNRSLFNTLTPGQARIKIEASNGEKEISIPDDATLLDPITITDQSIPLFQIADHSPAKGDYTYIAGSFNQNGIHYALTIEPGVNQFISEINTMLASLELFPPSFTQKISTPVATGSARFQDNRTGFTFVYPESWEFSGFQANHARLEQNDRIIELDLLYKSTASTGDRVQDLINHISIACAADGPNGYSECDPGSITLSLFTTQNKVVGYQITRIVTDSYSGQSSSHQQTSYAFPLDTQPYSAFIISPAAGSETDLTSVLLDLASSFAYLPPVTTE